jgi:hypothetical protein
MHCQLVLSSRVDRVVRLRAQILARTFHPFRNLRSARAARTRDQRFTAPERTTTRYPLPWSKLDYDTQLGGYRVDITENQLKGAPKFTRSTDWDWSNRTNDEKVYKYYNEPLWY